MKMDKWLKITISGIAVFLALFRLIFFDIASKRIDNTFLFLFATAVLVYVIPWKKVISFKGWGVELVLDKPQVKGALKGMGLKRLENEPLWKSLSRLESEIEQAKGGRVLWIDDNPHVILTERRTLRALGIEIVTASDSPSAEKILKGDNDFDLIISDVQRKGEIGNRATRYGGIYFLKELREKNVDPVIKSLPVIFYSAYRPDQIGRIKKQVGVKSLVGIEFCGSFETLLPRVITMLAEVRSNPITVSPKKKPTPLG